MLHSLPLLVIAALVLILPLTVAPTYADDDPTPNPIIVRRQIDAIIANTPNHQATVGTLIGAMQLSISYGAPAWNAGDHDACGNFYMKTGQSLIAAFDAANASTPAARLLLNDLKTALDRCHGSSDFDANAWTMRFVFDKTEAIATTEAERSLRFLQLGQACMARSQFPDASNAFAAATESLHELAGQPSDNIPIMCRYAPLALADALFGQKRYTEAAAAVEQGMHVFPAIADEKIDLRKHFADPAVYRLLSDDLQSAATDHPNDSSLQLLMAYHLFFTNQRDAAKPYLKKLLDQNPKHEAAKLLMQEYDPNRPKPRSDHPPLPGEEA